jgi:hypothetical protein
VHLQQQLLPTLHRTKPINRNKRGSIALTSLTDFQSQYSSQEDTTVEHVYFKIVKMHCDALWNHPFVAALAISCAVRKTKIVLIF